MMIWRLGTIMVTPPEQHLQVFRQLLSARVTRVHGNEEANARVQRHRGAVCERERLAALPDGIQDAVHLQTCTTTCRRPAYFTQYSTSICRSSASIDSPCGYESLATPSRVINFPIHHVHLHQLLQIGIQGAAAAAVYSPDLLRADRQHG